MSKLALFLLFFIVVSNATYLRPWENATWIASNPNILNVGTELWWNLPELQNTLDSAHFPETSCDSAVREEIENARIAKNAALKDYYACISLPEISKLFANPGYSPVALFQSFNAAAGCINYKEKWKSAVNHGLNSLELSEARALDSISQSKSAFHEVESAGLCNLTFYARPDDLCNSGHVAFSSYDSGLEEGDFGGFSIFKNHSREIAAQLQNPAPDFSAFAPSFEILWGENGTISLYSTLQNKSFEAIRTAELQYDVLHETAQKRKKSSESRFSELKKQKIHLIDRAPSSGQIYFTGKVSDVFSDLQARKSATDLELQEAELTRISVFANGYLGLAISRMNCTATNYSLLVSDATNLASDANLVVAQQKEEAAAEILESSLDKKLTPSSLELLQKANSSFSSAQKSTILGLKYEKYYDSAKFARMARSQRSPESQILIQTAISELETLISNAKRDGIDVASEEQTLSLLSGLDEHEIDPYIKSAISSIISKSQLKYGNELKAKRTELIRKIDLGGSLTQDLRQELFDFESGIVDGGTVRFPEAIGHLKELQSNYGYVERELEIHMSNIVGNAMSNSASPVFSQVYLDSPTEIELDLLLVNPLGYGAENAQVSVAMDPAIPFLYSDVTTGKESLSGLYADGGQLLLTFSNISKYDRKRIAMVRSMVLARTIKKTTHAVAVGNGMARVDEVLEFELDLKIPHLELLQSHEKVTIDGASPNRQLAEGKHTLESEYYVTDAYTESISNVRSYPIGSKSQVEYTITITSNVDLDRAPILVEFANSSDISSVSIYAITGEKTSKPKKLSEKAYSSEVSGIIANVPTKIYVGYLVEDSKSFFEFEAEPYLSADLGPGSTLLFEQAQTQAAAGNYTAALGLLKQLEAAHKSEQAGIAKTKKKTAELLSKLNGELSDLGSFLPADTSTSAFLDKLAARQAELSKISNNVLSLNTSEALAELEAVDFKWLGKALNSYAKSAYKEYNDLKERFYLAGNYSTPPEFATFESSLNRFQASPQTEYAVDLSSALQDVRQLVEAQEDTLSDEISRRKSLVADVGAQATSLIVPYEKQLSASKGTAYSGRFDVSVSSVEKQLKSAKSSAGDPSPIFWDDLGDLNNSVQKMTAILSSLRNESASSLLLTEHLLLGLPDSQAKSDLQKKHLVMKQLHESGEYVNSLRAGVAISEELEGLNTGDDNGLLILGISAVAILAALAFYMFKPKNKPILKKVPKLGDF